jgi:hypothetical protein
MDTDMETDIDTDTDGTWHVLFLASIRLYCPFSMVWRSNVKSWLKSQRRYELVALFSNENGDEQIHSSIGTAP